MRYFITAGGALAFLWGYYRVFDFARDNGGILGISATDILAVVMALGILGVAGGLF